jgi:hypothetical protein
MRVRPFSALLVTLLPAAVRPDSVKPIDFGPYMTNHVTYMGSPASYRYALNNAYYRFQVGWVEPISESAGGLLKDTYFETDGDFNISPFQSDLGTTFSLKPIRYLEFGLSYNRLMFHNSMVTWTAPTPGAKMIDLKSARPGDLMELNQEFGGADVFTFQGNFTLDMGPTQLYVMGARSLWDIDTPGKDFVYEYSNDMVIRPRDRVNTLLTQFGLDLSRFSRSPSYSWTGIAVRHQFWMTTRTEQEKSLVSAGITGIRVGRNPVRQRRGLDLSVGYWLDHPQLDRDNIAQSITFLMHWKWNVQFLKL